MSYQLTVAGENSPAGATDAELLRFFVNFAILAPSGHNTQPWLFKIREWSLDLLADRTRALPVVDPNNRHSQSLVARRSNISWWQRAVSAGTWRSTNCRVQIQIFLPPFGSPAM